MLVITALPSAANVLAHCRPTAASVEPGPAQTGPTFRYVRPSLYRGDPLGESISSIARSRAEAGPPLANSEHRAACCDFGLPIVRPRKVSNAQALLTVLSRRAIRT